MICSKFTELYNHRHHPVLEYFHPPKNIPPDLGDFDSVILGQTCEYVFEQVPGAFRDCGGVWGPTKPKPRLEGSFQSATRKGCCSTQTLPMAQGEVCQVEW